MSHLRHSSVIIGLFLAAALPAQAAGAVVSFTRIVLDAHFLAEGVGVADFNGDGKPDVWAGPYWFEGPAFTVKHEIGAPLAFDRESYSDAFIGGTDDFNGDGRPDVLKIGWPGREAAWLENPGRAGDWPRHLIYPEVGAESPAFADVNGDGRIDLVFAAGGKLGWAERDRSKLEAPWKFHPISPAGKWTRYTHGLGVGDVNGDGRKDILIAEGWWEQPVALGGDPVWKFHAADFGKGGAQMYVYDVNHDGRADVLTSVEAHGYGLSWFEQLKPIDGKESWREHPIVSRNPTEKLEGVQFSQLHAVRLADIDGDGLPDIITGKRHWAHGSQGDVEPNAPAVLYWFRMVRAANGDVTFEPHLIDSESGVGTQFEVADLNGDGFPDIAIANKSGVFVFLQRRN